MPLGIITRPDTSALTPRSFCKYAHRVQEQLARGEVVPELLRTLVFARPCGGDQFAAGTVSPSLDMSR